MFFIFSPLKSINPFSSLPSAAGIAFLRLQHYFPLPPTATPSQALETFAGAAHFSLGTELGVSVGPVGRTAGSDIRAGKGGVASAFAYAHSRGLFVGVSIEAGVIIRRHDANEAYYGGKFSARQLLVSSTPASMCPSIYPSSHTQSTPETQQ